MAAIQEDAETVETDNPLSVDDAAESILASFMKDSPEEADDSEEQEVSEKTKDDAEHDESKEDKEDSGEEDAQESEEDSEEGEGTAETTAEDIIEDDNGKYVKVKVDGEERTVSVKDLKRLYGQEASLTRKSQEVAAKRKESEELGAKYVAGLTGLLQKAQAKTAPYKQIDFLAAAQQLSPEDLQNLRTEAQVAFDEERYLAEELNGFMGNLQQQRQAQLVEKGREAVKELKEDIPGWNEKVYNDIRHFAISSGMEVGIVDNLVDAPAIKLIHKAMLYDRGKSGVVTTKTKNSPKKIIKSSKSTSQTRHATSGKPNEQKAYKKLQDSGSVDDAQDAFLARWENQSDD